MKIRKDFVSNSSSSSFVVYGTSIDVPENLTPEQKDDFRCRADWRDNLKQCNDSCGDTIIIGISPENMKGEETLNDFKKRVADTLNKYYPELNFKAEDIEYIQGTNQDGDFYGD